MDEFGARQLVASIVEQAVHDRRLAVTLGLIDDLALPVRTGLDTGQNEIIMHLHSFFFRDGLEIALDTAGFDISLDAIRRKSSEPFDGRKRRTEG